MTGSSILTDRGKLCYWTQAGEASLCLVFLHGLTCNHGYFEPQVQAFGGRYPILAWDAPLHGESRFYSPFTFAQAAEDLEAILAKEGYNRVVLVGHSMGGVLGQHYLKSYSSRVCAFVGVDTLPIDPTYYTFIDKASIGYLPVSLAHIPDGNLRYGMAYYNCESPLAVTYMVDHLNTYSKRDIVTLMETYSSQFLQELKPMSLEKPSLLCIGIHDQNPIIQRVTPIWASQDQAKLAIIGGAGHCSSLDNPGVFHDYLECFLQTL